MADFLAHVQQFSRLLGNINLKFGVLLKQFATFLLSFSVWFFKMEFNLLPELLNTGFTIIEIGLFYDGEHLGAKICRFLTFVFTKSFQDGHFSSVLNRGWRHVSFSNVLLKHWAFFLKDMLINSKTRYLLHFFYD